MAGGVIHLQYVPFPPQSCRRDLCCHSRGISVAEWAAIYGSGNWLDFQLPECQSFLCNRREQTGNRWERSGGWNWRVWCVIKTVSTETAEHYTWGDRCDGWHLLESDDLSVIQERMPPKTSEEEHFHARSRQFFYVISGTLSILLDDTLHQLATANGLEVAPKVAHRVFNDTDADVRFIVVSTPPSHGDKIVAAQSRVV